MNYDATGQAYDPEFDYTDETRDMLLIEDQVVI